MIIEAAFYNLSSFIKIDNKIFIKKSFKAYRIEHYTKIKFCCNT
ncbi:MAG: hypothetical protein RI894_2109 [Bacteroidota bacterium]|jgi:hypothetical protein